MINTMESEIYNEIAELRGRKSEIEADIVDWFENWEDSEEDEKNRYIRAKRKYSEMDRRKVI